MTLFANAVSGQAVKSRWNFYVLNVLQIFYTSFSMRRVGLPEAVRDGVNRRTECRKAVTTPGPPLMRANPPKGR